MSFFNDVKISRTFICFVFLVWARPTGDTVNNKADAVDDDKVELEKSNILLMGPTGSGNYCVHCAFQFMFVECVIITKFKDSHCFWNLIFHNWLFWVMIYPKSFMSNIFLKISSVKAPLLWNWIVPFLLTNQILLLESMLTLAWR